MNNSRFDSLTRAFGSGASRRAMFRLGAAAFGTAFGVVAVHEVAACKKPGKKCKKAKQCCSGTCQGKKGKKKCKVTPGALGCTVEDACSVPVLCPDAVGTCAVTVTGKPLCYNTGGCFACDSDADCDGALALTSARCVVCALPECEAVNFRACVAFLVASGTTTESG